MVVWPDGPDSRRTDRAGRISVMWTGGRGDRPKSSFVLESAPKSPAAVQCPIGGCRLGGLPVGSSGSRLQIILETYQVTGPREVDAGKWAVGRGPAPMAK